MKISSTEIEEPVWQFGFNIFKATSHLPESLSITTIVWERYKQPNLFCRYFLKPWTLRLGLKACVLTNTLFSTEVASTTYHLGEKCKNFRLPLTTEGSETRLEKNWIKDERFANKPIVNCAQGKKIFLKRTLFPLNIFYNGA